MGVHVKMLLNVTLFHHYIVDTMIENVFYGNPLYSWKQIWKRFNVHCSSSSVALYNPSKNFENIWKCITVCIRANPKNNFLPHLPFFLHIIYQIRWCKIMPLKYTMKEHIVRFRKKDKDILAWSGKWKVFTIYFST